MSNFIIGTAGHIDHGKTELIKALTNIETDRFDEEKKRGITIDLGFAYLDTPDGDKIGIVDVPGHEKFIKNMLAGVSGIDLVLLIVSAEESVMPQTKEHIDILRFLDIDNGIICITKKDLVQDEFIPLVKEEIKEYTRDTFLENSKIISTSSVTKEGISELKDEIIKIYNKDLEAPNIKKFRMPIDRAFTLKGLGTIITGTLIEGEISVGEEIEIFPSNLKTKARTIQVHNENVEKATSGQRVAINIPGISKEDINRGDVIGSPNSLMETDLIDVEISVLKDSKRVIQNNTRLRLYIGTNEVMCRTKLLDKEILGPGDSGFVQLKLEDNIVCQYNDKFVIRFYSPLETIAGGKILKTNTKFHKTFDSKVINDLKIISKGNDKEIIENYLFNNFYKENNLFNISKYTGLSKVKVKEKFKELVANEKIFKIDDIYFSKRFFDKKKKELILFLKTFHENNPILKGVNKGEILKKIFNDIDKKYFDELVSLIEKEKIIKLNDSIVSLNDFEINYTQKQELIKENIIDYYKKVKFEPLRINEVFEKLNLSKTGKLICENLIDKGILVRLNQDIILHKKHIRNSKNVLKEYFDKHKSIDLSEFRDLLDTSRKVALPLLEYLDTVKFTKRLEDDSRILMD
ncbi:MAG: selenocysteine-specific translation elongation factor [Bacillota bacterium]